MLAVPPWRPKKETKPYLGSGRLLSFCGWAHCCTTVGVAEIGLSRKGIEMGGGQLFFSFELLSVADLGGSHRHKHR